MDELSHQTNVHHALDNSLPGYGKPRQLGKRPFSFHYEVDTGKKRTFRHSYQTK
jgi:hypothetical protein